MTSHPATIAKHHFGLLDGLRGVAAVAVVIFHFMELIRPDYKDSFIAHAYLAVDFFFCLSGFVIAYAYDSRIKEIGFTAFLKLRFIRLHPLVIIGSVIGLMSFTLDPFSNLYQKYSADLPTMFAASSLMIPYPLVHERYFNLYHLNPPSWSLFWEYIANIFYGLFLFKIADKHLWIFVIIAAGAIFYEANTSGNLAVGWGGDNVRGGGIRILYSFLAGILLYRSKWLIRSKITFPLITLMLLAVFLIPYIDLLNPFLEPVIVILYFPFLIAVRAGNYSLRTKSNQELEQSPRAATGKWERLSAFSGEISYPLYMIHYPFIWIFMSYVEASKPSLSEMVVIMLLSTTVIIGFAYVVLTYIDKPIRRWLRRSFINA
jgi:peptidoglycan/LPS O-acetylase OafA/YrhL